MPGVWYGSLPDMGVERHYRKMTPEAVEALNTILDIESQPGGAELPSWEEIEAEETEEARLKAERKAALAEKEAAQRASRVSVRDARVAAARLGSARRLWLASPSGPATAPSRSTGGLSTSACRTSITADG